MSIAKKLGIGLVSLISILVLFAAVAVARNAYAPLRPVGMQQVLVENPGHQPIPTTIWYPSDTPPHWTWAGLWAAKLAVDGAIDGAKLPMVVMSHGTGATALSHLDTALALAEAGYVVVAPLHSGDNYRDDTLVGTPAWFVSRSNDVRQVDDYMINRWPGRTHIDSQKLGIFGFSAGGTTGLIAIGGEPDLSLVKAQCAAHPEFVCTLRKGSDDQGPTAPVWTHDPRIKAAVIVAPGLGFAFPRSRLTNVRAPVQLWDGDRDAQVPLATNSAAVRANLPTRASYHVIAGAGHFAFLPPCGAMSVILPAMLCRDQAGFDRKAFHGTFDAAVVQFFNDQLDHR